MKANPPHKSQHNCNTARVQQDTGKYLNYSRTSLQNCLSNHPANNHLNPWTPSASVPPLTVSQSTNPPPPNSPSNQNERMYQWDHIGEKEPGKEEVDERENGKNNWNSITDCIRGKQLSPCRNLEKLPASRALLRIAASTEKNDKHPNDNFPN